MDDNRFRRPQPVTPWTGTKHTLVDGSICPQINVKNKLFIGSEDCLTLNVYVPKGKGPFPVMVWIYGGGFKVGDKSEFGLYAGQNFAKQGVVLVAGNYRLAALGYLALDDLMDEDEDRSTGNYAMQDQVAVLEWVQRNIKAFQGDPNHVTIFGESAGAISVWWHLVSPRSQGLFHAAMSESGGADGKDWFFMEGKQAMDWGEHYALGLGCDRSKLQSTEFLACMRALSTSDVMTHTFDANSPALSGYVPPLYPYLSWAPVIDGSKAGTLALPFELLRKGEFARVPMLAGTNHDEGIGFIKRVAELPGCGTYPLTTDGLKKTMLHIIPGSNATLADIVLNYYQKQGTDPNDVAAVFFRDFAFACPTRRGLRAMSQQDTANDHFMYRWSYIGDWRGFNAPGEDNHASELYFVWNNPFPPVLHRFSAQDQAMATIMNTMWSNFGKSHNPNFPTQVQTNGVTWPVYNSTTEQYLILQSQPTVEDALLEENCLFLDSMFGYN